ncbi:MAG: hypothetical protein AB8G26_04260 [Ilumatobacter sp.]
MRVGKRTTLVAGMALACAMGVGLLPASGADAAAGEFVPRRPAASQSTCAGIRGNGQNLFAHYGALARHVEEYGVVTCAAGGSSGSITTFLMESMWANPGVQNCTNDRGRLRRCSAAELNQRMSLMLKSVVAVPELGLFADVGTVGAIIGEVTAGDIEGLLETDPVAGVEAFVRILRDVGPLINPELFELLANSPDPVFHVTDIIDGLEKGVQFIVDDPAVFVRTSVLDFEEVARFFGTYGSFYAAYGPADRAGLAAWLDTCAPATIGRTWSETATLPGPDGETCGEAFAALFNEYREAFAADPSAPNRADDPVGRYLPVFGVTGVLTGDAIPEWRAARDAWLAAEPFDFDIDFDDVGVGYWGREVELRRIDRRLDQRYDDLIADQFVPLGRSTWLEVLKSSPAEPGFSPAVPLAAGPISVGGWADPLRVIPLDALNAKRTITINRVDGVGGFTEQVTRLLNADDDDVAALYSTTDPESSFYIGLDIVDGVWCTDWDSQGGDPNRLFDDAYDSPFITSNRRFLRPNFGYPNAGPDFSIQGCTPGVPV